MGHPEPVPAPLVRPPRLSGRYVVARLIGKGAQARVYLAFDGRLKQWRAVKVLAPNYLDDDQVRARFEQEAQAMARLTHPNLIRVVDVDHDGRTPYMVMELARGGSITEWIKRHGPVPSVLACRIAQACCEGLHHAHVTGVVHRDVKPHNILIRDDGSLGLTDFGIAQVLENQSLTATGTIMGTFAFMAPEQRTDSKSVDLRADVYSLGASLYTMLTGRTSAELFFAESRDAILAGIPEALRPVILTACKYEREHRYGTMLEFRDAIERRIPRLHPDPRGTVLLSAMLELPSGPPGWVDANAGVDELSKALVPGDDLPTLTRAAATPEADPPSQTSLHEGNQTATSTSGPVPYRMPNTTSSHGKPRDMDEVPAYVADATAFAHPPFKQVQIDDIGARTLHGADPRSTHRSLWFYAAMSAGTVLGFFCALVLTGLLGKVYTSWHLSSASEALVLTANEERQVLVDLVAAGADEAALQDRWYQIQDADEASRPQAAAAFAEYVAAEAETTGVEGLALSHVSQLSRARREWRDATLLQATIRESFVGRLSGDIGIW